MIIVELVESSLDNFETRQMSYTQFFTEVVLASVEKQRKCNFLKKNRYGVVITLVEKVAFKKTIYVKLNAY